MANTARRKVAALLAAGAVFGVGAAVTLAAWNDSEFARSDFAAGSFNLEGTTEGAAGTYSDHASSSPAALEFTAPLDLNLTPGDVVYAPFWVRLDASTTTPANLVAQSASGTGANAANLGYSVHQLAPGANCDAATTASTPVVASGATLDDLASGGATVPLGIGADTAAGAPVQLCFVVTATDDLVQGEAATATWGFLATSTDD